MTNANAALVNSGGVVTQVIVVNTDDNTYVPPTGLNVYVLDEDSQNVGAGWSLNEDGEWAAPLTHEDTGDQPPSLEDVVASMQSLIDGQQDQLDALLDFLMSSQ